jgi:hypothetical protein
MNARWIGGAAVVGLFAWAAVAAGNGVWVSNEGKAKVIGSGMHAFFIDDEGGDRFDLADLRDGETKTFGSGDKQLTATRTGDEVALSRPAHGKESAMRVTCKLSSDHCSVVTFDDDPEKVMVIVQKTRECIDGEGDCDADADVDIVSGVGGPGAHHVIVRKIECNGDDCENLDEAGSADLPMKIVRVHSGPSDRVTLRCPKGDTTMRVAPDEADKSYLCPKHSLRLEK